MENIVGIDFGTTNSAVAVADQSGYVTTARFHYEDIDAETFRSILFFVPPGKSPRKPMSSYAGPEAIHHYLHGESGGRLIQSIKSYLSDSTLRSSNLFGRNYRFEELLAFLLRSLKSAAVSSGLPFGTRAVVGRPVRFVGSNGPEDDLYAISRLKEALALAGITEVQFELEPVAAAYSYEALLNHEELLLVADFGGGTTDFSLIRVGPEARKVKGAERRVLANAGLGIAGDDFDAKLVRHLVAPLLGRGSMCRLVGKTAPMPNWPFAKLEHWHQLSFLKSKENMEALRSLRAQAIEPEKIENLIFLITEDLGFKLHSAVQRTKYELSSKPKSLFSFSVPGIEISAMVTRQQFEDWISQELHSIANCVDELLQQAGIKPSQINRVFLTGGSSFVPAVRALFEQRFGASRLASGSEFTSVAKGLALRAIEARR
jgi:hypothetical chaperone protein